jgi:outer membrane protein assembly factor BamB
MPVPGMVFFYALDAATGEPIWKREAHASVRPPTAIEDGSLFATDDGGNLYILDARTGQERLMFRTPGSGTASPVAANGLVTFLPGAECTQLMPTPKRYQDSTC